jgi:hypothetical protein
MDSLLILIPVEQVSSITYQSEKVFMASEVIN